MQSFAIAASWPPPAFATAPTAGTDRARPVGALPSAVVIPRPLAVAGAPQRMAKWNQADDHRVKANVATPSSARNVGATKNPAVAFAGRSAAGYGLRPRGTPLS